ncbi:glycosyl hydrolase family 1 [Actinocrispum wychmicini]|uniref:Glycosyl hydrolase family 1 n=1 Tax=Actinocrispum wychmicini TaxID=1213861 RepID=A0A4R2JZA1_9PSEU|nr:glycosyl hydrolase family 1 [Actinocrispum wychmicini]
MVPDGFLWGVSRSAFQIEGVTRDDAPLVPGGRA